MPASRPTNPIIIAATTKPSHNHSNLSPSTPPSPKQVRFAPQSAQLASRPLTQREAWSLYHFETHTRSCRSCGASSHSLCDAGYGLSQDVRVLICKHDNQLCSTHADSEGNWVRVEVPHGYDRTKTMLGVRDLKKKQSPPVISYDPEPRPSRKREPSWAGNVYVEPARTPNVNDEERRRSRHKPERYEVVEVTPPVSKYEKGEPVQRLPERAKRGSLYESDMRRERREYRIEERTPASKERSQDRGWKDKEREERRERRRREREWR